MKRPLLLLITSVAIAACTTTSPATRALTHEGEPAPMAQPSTAAEAEPESLPAPPEPEPEPSGPPKLHVIVNAGTYVGLHPLFDGEVAVSVGPQLIRVEPGGNLTPDPTMLLELPHPRGPGEHNNLEWESWHVLAAGGRWRDELMMTTLVVSGFRTEGLYPEVARYDGRQWREVNDRNKRLRWHPVEFGPWIEGSVLARRVFEPWYGQEFFLEEDKGPSRAEIAASAAAIRRAKPLIVVRGRPKVPNLGKGGVSTFRSWATGEILVVTAQRRPELRVAGPRGVRSSIALPVRDGHEVSIHGISADTPERALIYGREHAEGDGPARSYLVRWEGDQTEVLEGPPCKPGIGSLVDSPRHGMWAICGVSPGESTPEDSRPVWHRDPQGKWTEVPIEDDSDLTSPSRVMLIDGEVWIAMGTKILSTAPAAAVTELPDLDTIANQVLEYSEPIDPYDFCDAAFIRLSTPVGEAAAIKAKLDAAFDGFEVSGSVELRTLVYRGKPTLGIQLADSMELANVRRVERVVRRALGDAAQPIQCYWSYVKKDAESGRVAEWDLWGSE